MRSLFLSADLIIIGYYAIVTAIVLVSWGSVASPGAYLVLHAGVIGSVMLAAWGDRRFGGRTWAECHAWIMVPMILVAFRELHYLIPEVRPYSDLGYDAALAALDRMVFGDVDAFFHGIASPWLADLLMLCYLSYFVMPVALGIRMSWRGRREAFREIAAVLAAGWFLSYLGYFMVPALGPHLAVDGARAPELAGMLWAETLYRGLMALELEMPDAFPSGHTLVAALTLGLAWRHDRSLFRVLLPFAAGLVLATLYLRYHYAVDVLAGLALAPPAWAIGTRIDRAWRYQDAIAVGAVYRERRREGAA